MADTRPENYPRLENYSPTRFMLPTSHYDAEKADRAIRFFENLCHTKGSWAGTRFWLLPWQRIRNCKKGWNASIPYSLY